MRTLNQIAHAAAVRVLAAAVLVLTVSTASAATKLSLLKNSAFGSDPPAGGCVYGTTKLPAWAVSTGSIDILSAATACGSIVPPRSEYFLNLTGGADTGAGTISQSAATTIGTLYILTFSFGGNPEWQTGCFGTGNVNDGPTKTMNVLVSGTVPISANYTIDTTGLACTDPGWTFEGIFFTATSTTTTVTFQSLDASGVYGPVLAAVKLVATNNTETGDIEE